MQTPFRLEGEGQRFRRCVSPVGYPLSMLAAVGAAGREYIFSSPVQLLNTGRSGHMGTSFAEVHTCYASVCPIA